MIVVTGGAGFIGSCIIAKLNALGRADLLVVDHMADPKKGNLAGKKYETYYEKADFLELIKRDQLSRRIETVIHMGACSSTTLMDAEYFEENNFVYSRHVAEWCLQRGIRMIYASSAATYGAGELGYRDDEERLDALQPLNLYGASKHKFDLWARDHGHLEQIVGLKFFNVFGPNEYHKGDMRSVVAKAYDRVVREGKMSLFKSYRPDYPDGEQKRDFIYVSDAVDIVLFFWKNTTVNGIFNVGTGTARTWNDLAAALFAAVGKPPHIEYIPMPEPLRPRYQYFTQADMTKLREAGYTGTFTSLEAAVRDYVGYLKDHRYL